MADNLPHIYLNGPNSIIPYTTGSTVVIKPKVIERDRKTHGQYIEKRLTTAWEESESEIAVYENTRNGVYIEFQSPPDFELANMSFENIRKKIRLCNIRKSEGISYVTLYIPNKEKEIFFKKINEYILEDTRFNKPKNAKLIEGIEDLRKALLVESFWVDDSNLMPKDDKEWCEVWLRGNSKEILANFEEKLTILDIEFKEGFIKFPERCVKLIHATKTDLGQLTIYSDDIAEYRRAKNTADFILTESPASQSEWGKDLLDRLEVDKSSNVSICILDSGINYSHPLLQDILDENDCQSVEASWGNEDKDNHGTLMAGLAVYGNLQEALERSDTIKIEHRLESVKLINKKEQTSPELWGEYTSRAISLAEIQKPKYKRISCMAITAEDSRDNGEPSSWSGAVDQIISGSDGSDKRLLIVSTGNSTAINSDFNNIAKYPKFQIEDSIHDPGQAWNVLTVGAYTKLSLLKDKDYSGFITVANENQLSPFTTTSNTWNNSWPIKPEVVFEGGNVAVDSTGFATEADDLSLISTYFKPQERLFDHFSMTSASTAQAANFAAKIQTQYPEYWPETIRALIVHSAEWTAEMKAQFAENNNKSELLNVLRSCGYGVPNLYRALYCAKNSLTLISEARIQPFHKHDGSYKTKDMHLYELPWPQEELEKLGENEIEMKVTLSYYIEPGPGKIGWKDRYRYQSHGLRFDLNSPTDNKDDFINKINAASRNDDYDSSLQSKSKVNWFIGKQQRDKGSIHSDTWKGTALELLTSKYIAVYPTIGWWRERPHLKCYDKIARYSLIVSIKTQETDVDIYTPIMNKVTIPLTIKT